MLFLFVKVQLTRARVFFFLKFVTDSKKVVRCFQSSENMCQSIQKDLHLLNSRSFLANCFTSSRNCPAVKFYGIQCLSSLQSRFLDLFSILFFLFLTFIHLTIMFASYCPQFPEDYPIKNE